MEKEIYSSGLVLEGGGIRALYASGVLDAFMEKEIERGDCFLLCSDGLTDMLSGEQILHILREEDSAKACAEHLVQEALDHGGYDNITVMVVKMK